jgi:hypothetical protein
MKDKDLKRVRARLFEELGFSRGELWEKFYHYCGDKEILEVKGLMEDRFSSIDVFFVFHGVFAEEAKDNFTSVLGFNRQLVTSRILEEL